MATTSPLRQRMIEDMMIRNLSRATQQSYIYAVARFSRHFNSSPDRLGMEEVRAYQLHLVAKNHSWSHINQVACALRFFYGVTLGHKEAFERIVFGREPEKLPAVLNAEEVVRFLEAVEGLRNRIALTTAYAAGLRVREVTRLRIDERTAPGARDQKIGIAGSDDGAQLYLEPTDPRRLKEPRSVSRSRRKYYWVDGRARKFWKIRASERDNHFLDCRIMCMALAEHLGLSSLTPSEWAGLTRERGASACPRNAGGPGAAPGATLADLEATEDHDVAARLERLAAANAARFR